MAWLVIQRFCNALAGMHEHKVGIYMPRRAGHRGEEADLPRGCKRQQCRCACRRQPQTLRAVGEQVCSNTQKAELGALGSPEAEHSLARSGQRRNRDGR